MAEPRRTAGCMHLAPSRVALACTPPCSLMHCRALPSPCLHIPTFLSRVGDLSTCFIHPSRPLQAMSHAASHAHVTPAASATHIG